VKVDPELQQAIMRHPSDDLAKVAKDVGAQLGRVVPITMVVKIKGSVQRAADVNRAKEVAAGTLDTKIGRIEVASDVLERIFLDEGLTLKDRIEASKELRQWTRLGMDAAGMADESTDTLWVVGGEWDTTPKGPA